MSAGEIVYPVDIADFDVFFDPVIRALVHPSPIATPLEDEIDRIAAQRGFARSAAVPSANAEGALANLFEPETSAMIAIWVEVLAELTGAGSVGVRMVRLDSAMCPRLHVDRVTARLVRSLRGPGTEIARENDVDRARLGRAGETDDEHVLRHGAVLACAQAGDVVVLKGESWPETSGKGAVHRSPGMAPGQTRVLLTLDALL